ncbi:MAG: polysaccharide deacetylase [Parcubacteria group bacterium Athens0714_24]|nr:MAG: polysaccharide deacetylase [Parcubacteria group bacterium Athens0714_24]
MFFKKILKTNFSLFLNVVSVFLPKKKAVILLYHSIDRNDVYLTIRPEIFEKQMCYLKENKYLVISLKELVENIKTKKEIQPKTVILTFDDGFLSHYEKVWPILKKNNFPATFFISTGLVGSKINNSQNMPQPTANWEQIIEISQSSLIDIEPHSVNHYELDKLSLAEAENEIVESKNEIERRTGKKCLFFAPPRGKYNKETLNLLKKNNFEAMVIVKEGLVRTNDDLFFLKRKTINSSCSNHIQFRAKLVF